jgi:hypothetical protein
MPKGHLVERGGDGREMARPRLSRRAPRRCHSRAVAALVMVSMVVKVFEATTISVAPGRAGKRVGDMRAVDIGDEMQSRAVMIGRQRQRRHHRTEIGAADADIDHIGERLAPVAPSDRAGAHPVAETQLPPQDLADIRLRQFVAKLDIARPLVVGQVLGAMRLDHLFGNAFVLAHHEQLDHLAGLFVRNADGAASMMPGCAAATSSTSFG